MIYIVKDVSSDKLLAIFTNYEDVQDYCDETTEYFELEL